MPVDKWSTGFYGFCRQKKQLVMHRMDKALLSLIYKELLQMDKKIIQGNKIRKEAITKAKKEEKILNFINGE